jgi:(p)ppGpp synthase/HD superfamily hydrolase
MSVESRVLKLEDKLNTMGHTETLRAVDLIKSEMNAKKGFKRHDGSDYWGHCTDVTLLLVNAGVKEQPVLTASMIHDYPEDVDGITVETVKHLFGTDVADIVRPLTKIEGVNYKDLNNLKQYYQPILQDYRCSLVKAADIMHNMSTLGDAKRDKKLRKIQEAKEVFLPFLKEAKEKFPRYSHFFYMVKFTLEPLIREMEERYETEIKLETRNKELELVVNGHTRGVAL